MVATAPETKSESKDQGWLDPFLADWETGTGSEREVREPATGRHLLTPRPLEPHAKKWLPLFG